MLTICRQACNNHYIKARACQVLGSSRERPGMFSCSRTHPPSNLMGIQSSTASVVLCAHIINASNDGHAMKHNERLMLFTSPSTSKDDADTQMREVVDVRESACRPLERHRIADVRPGGRQAAEMAPNSIMRALHYSEDERRADHAMKPSLNSDPSHGPVRTMEGRCRR